MKISRLRLLGFKSFVEPTDLLIEAGLTGVVGPNGCGKSNLLEALRWVMGETSYKSMRASAMDEVIFSGTSVRPPRDTAEVTIFIDNSERQAPADFNGHDEIEITRRIEREAGSAYRINGKEARARDIKLLFEDAATGARSPALVRQGQIAEIVNAKPEQRRRVLEDAAGTAGLHSRRHEADLRLKAAENNLTRLQDVLGQINSQIDTLKRQARQARRYKEISGEIRKIEALAMHLSWAEAHAIVAQEESQLTQAMAELAKATATESATVREEAGLADDLPPLREAEAARGAVVGRLNVERENLDRESKRLAERQIELHQRKRQLETDITREQDLVNEAAEILERLDKEIGGLTAAQESAVEDEADVREKLTAARSQLAEAEVILSDLSTQAAEAMAHRQGLEASRLERAEAVAKIENRLAMLVRQAQEIAARAPDAQKLTATTEAGQRLARDLARIEAEALSAEEHLREAAGAAKKTRNVAERSTLAANAFEIERDTLVKLVSPARDQAWPPIIDEIDVDPGFEAALGAALGDDLDAPAAEDSPVHWTKLDAQTADAEFPAGVEPLSLHVKAPAELARRLKFVGLIDRDQGKRLQAHLKPGQRLVTREGDLWRWDGYVAAAEGITPATQRLRERNRLGDVTQRAADALEAAAQAADADEQALQELERAESQERNLRRLWRDSQAELAQTRDALTFIERAARETETKLAAVADASRNAEGDLENAKSRLRDIENLLTNDAAAEDLTTKLAAAKDRVAVLREAAGEARGHVSSLEQQQLARRERIAAGKSERTRWQTRKDGALKQITTLKERIAETDEELGSLADLPGKIEQKNQSLLTEMQGAEQHRLEAADRLAEAENTLRSARQRVREAQDGVAAAREARARAEAMLEGARTRRQDEARRIRETFNVSPEGCLELAELSPGSTLPKRADTDQKLTRMKADRERLGGVNMQADDELTILMEQFASMDTERLDVEQAVTKLKSAIQQLNREGAKRLEDAFNKVDAHFRDLFTTLFGGGEARLEMLQADDPLEGGLEIIAKPPGKKPVTLSLLSGGEQTLTALSLIFAVFLTNPAPICVLDEVDAPLDDANVDRFCTLMEKMARDTDTRFLVITHHPVTMTRMNRLFGVTMAEKGISQLVSVDLETAQTLREAV